MLLRSVCADKPAYCVLCQTHVTGRLAGVLGYVETDDALDRDSCQVM